MACIYCKRFNFQAYLCLSASKSTSSMGIPFAFAGAGRGLLSLQQQRRRRRSSSRCYLAKFLDSTRRDVNIALVVGAAESLFVYEEAEAASTSKRALRAQKIPESEYISLPSGLKYYDLKVGSGPEAVKGSRVAVHYVAKWKGVTFMTSRQGLGITGGTPYGFEIGASERGTVLKGLDMGVEGMKAGGQRLLIIPPELAYGNKGIQEIPPNAILEFDVELLSVKQLPYG